MAEVTLPGAARDVSPALQRAALTGAAVLALLVFVLYTQAPSVLPGYPAVVVSFAAWFVLPGWALQRLLVRSRSAIEQALASFLCSVGLAAMPGLLALRWHWSLDGFALGYALLAAAVSAAAVLLTPDEAPEEVEDAGASSPGKAPLLVLIALPLLAIASVPWWGSDLIARDADDWVYMTYVNEYMHEDKLDADAVAAGGGSFQRMLTNVWVVDEALVADSANVAPYDALMAYLPPLLSLLAVGATFVVARGLFKNTMVGLLAAGFHIGYAILDLSAHEGFGRNVLLRIPEDKMVASFVLLPVAVLYSATFIARPHARYLAIALLAGLALFVVHPVGVIYLALLAGAFAAVRAVTERSARALLGGAALLLPLLAFALATHKYLPDDDASAARTAAAAFDPRLLFRENLHTVAIDHGWSIANYHVILHPLMLAALALAPLVWFLRRRSAGAQYVLAASLVVSFMLFFPPVTTEFGERLSWNAVWRMPWAIPVAMTLAAATYEGASWLGARSAIERSPRWQALLPAAALVVALGAGMIVLEQYSRADGGAYYNRVSSSSVLPGSDGSITLGGIDRMFSHEWRLSGDARELIAELHDRVPEGSTLLADRHFSTYLPGTLPNVDIYAPLGSGTAEELALQNAVYSGKIGRDDLAGALGAAGIDLVMLQTNTAADSAVRPPLASYAPEDLSPVAGTPRLVDVGGRRLWWLGPDTSGQVGGSPFTIPGDVNPGNRQIQFDVAVVTPHGMTVSGVVRIVVSFRDLGVAGAMAQNAVSDVPLRPGRSPVVHRAPRLEVSAGQQYEVSVWRQGAAEEDTLQSEIYIAGLDVRYWPAGLDLIDGTGYYLAAVPGR